MLMALHVIVQGHCMIANVDGGNWYNYCLDTQTEARPNMHIMHACLSRTYIHTHTRMHACTHTQCHACTHAHSLVRTHARTDTHTHTDTFMHTRSLMHKHTRIQKLTVLPTHLNLIVRAHPATHARKHVCHL